MGCVFIMGDTLGLLDLSFLVWIGYKDSMLYKVLLPNPYFKVGSVIEDDEDGMVQRIRFRTENGRMQPGGFEGICLSLGLVRKYCIPLLKRGVDENGAIAELRKAY